MKLYVNPASPFARKVSITIAELGLGAQVQEQTATVSPITRNEEIARDNPLTKIPTLILNDGTALFDSPVICEYLDHASGTPRLFPPAGPARWAALRRQALADGLMDAAILMRYESVLRTETLRWPEWLDGQKRKITGALDAMEKDGAGLGAGFDIGHISFACALGYLDLRFDHFQWRGGRPALAAWFAVMNQRASVAATTPKV